MAKQTINNVKLGIFVLVGAALLITALYLLGKNQNIFSKNFELKARFKNVGGLAKGNNVRYAGIQVGTIKSVEIINDTVIEVVMSVDQKLKPIIHKKSKASIGSEGLMGNKVINISAGDEPSPPVDEGDYLVATKTVAPEELLETLDKTNKNIAIISEDLKVTATRLKNSKALWGVLEDESLPADIKRLVSNLKSASGKADYLVNNGSKIVSDLQSIVRDVKNGKGSVGTLLKDTSFAVQLNLAVTKIKSAGENADKLAVQLNDAVAKIENEIQNGKGPIQTILKDTAMADKLKSSITNIEEATSSFDENMEALKHHFLFKGYFKRLNRQVYKERQRRERIDSINIRKSMQQ